MTSSLHSEKYRKFITTLVSVRRKQGLTQQKVAERLGKPQSYVAKTERCERRLDLAEFILLSKALDFEPRRLFDIVLEEVLSPNHDEYHP
ncbi:MAG: helix-turn-helix transcriptional regulator [Alphaproteobacteria bacterium]|nr:helix-turn-helix transcriptional regulator [Alphaproteobacteria bacterium]